MNRTTTKNAILIVGLLGVMVAGQPMAAGSCRYIGSGDYNDLYSVTGTNGWGPGCTCPGGLPCTNDTIRVNWGDNTVTLTNVVTVSRFQIGVDESGRLVVASGGGLTTIGTFANSIGNNGGGDVTGRLTVYTNGVVNSASVLEVGASANGILTIDGGSMNCSNHLWVGSGAFGVSSGTIVLTNGGTLNMTATNGGNGMLGLGTINASSPSGGIGIVNVSAGSVFNLFTIDPNGNSIQPGSVLDISGSGIVTIPNDRTAIMSNYVAAGKITAYGGTGTVGIDYNNTNLGKTTLYAIAPVAPPRQSITGATASGGNVTLTYQTTAGLFYHIESTPSLSPALWTPVAGSITNATGASVTFTFPTSGEPTFYRTVSP
jgi:hypothetical protein